MDNHNLKERRQASIGAIKELKRRWAPVSKHLVTFQSEANAPHYGVFPHQPVEAIAHSEVLAGWEEPPSRECGFVLEQSTKDHKEGFCTPPMNLSQLKRYAKGDPYRLIPRCVITQASGKQRLIDYAARGGRSASSRDANKLVLCTPLRPALHVQAAAACLQECTWERFAQQGQTIGRMPTAAVLCHDRRPGS